MRNKLLIASIIAVIFATVGIASAYDCPGPEEWADVNTPSLQNLYSISATGTVTVTYTAGGVPSSSTIREVCIASTSSNAISGTVDWTNWGPADLTIQPAKPQWERAWAEYKDGGETNDIPSDGAMHPVGTVTWDVAPDGTQVFLLHVSDDGCPDGVGSSCYVIPQGQDPPIPETSTIILTSVGLLGLVLVSRKYKK